VASRFHTVMARFTGASAASTATSATSATSWHPWRRSWRLLQPRSQQHR
jgi:hypothetical protein